MNRLSCYCAFCRQPRQVYRKKGFDLKNLLGAASLGLVFGWVFWGELDPRMFILAGFFLMVLELFILLRRRLELSCPHCGFDPIIYARSPERACEIVKEHLAARSLDPDVVLGRKPSLKLPTRKPETQKAVTKGINRDIVI